MGNVETVSIGPNTFAEAKLEMYGETPILSVVLGAQPNTKEIDAIRKAIDEARNRCDGIHIVIDLNGHKGLSLANSFLSINDIIELAVQRIIRSVTVLVPKELVNDASLLIATKVPGFKRIILDPVFNNLNTGVLSNKESSVAHALRSYVFQNHGILIPFPTAKKNRPSSEPDEPTSSWEPTTAHTVLQFLTGNGAK